MPLTPEAWEVAQRSFAAVQPAVAELSYFTLCLWLSEGGIAMSRLGDDFLLLDFDDRGPASMFVSLRHEPRWTPTVRAEVAHVVRTRSLRYLTTTTVNALDPVFSDLGVSPRADRGHADYLLSMERLATLPGAEFKSKRRAVRRLERRHSVAVREGRLSESWAQRHVNETYDRWERSKFGDADVPGYVAVERSGIDRWPGWMLPRIRVFALLVDGRPAGVSLVEEMWSATWMGVVFKTDPSLPGATAYLRRHVARVGLAALGVDGTLNIQQDDGEPGLRTAKSAYHPVRLEPKYALGAAAGTWEEPVLCSP